MYSVKHLRYCLGLALLLAAFSCKTNTDRPASQSLPMVKHTDSRAAIRLLQGCWLAVDYMEDIKKYKSPWHTYNALGTLIMPMIAITLDTNDIKRDTLFGGCSINDHEGGNLDLVLRQSADGSFRLVRNYNDTAHLLDSRGSITIRIEGPDTVLYVNNLDKNGKITLSKAYKRIFSYVSDNIETAMKYFIKNELFSGTYDMEGKTVTFLKDGKTIWDGEEKQMTFETDMCCGIIGWIILYSKARLLLK